MISARARPSGWSGKVKLERAQVRLGAPRGIHAEVSGSFSDARPFLALLGDKAGVPRWATALLEAQGLQIRGSLDYAGQALSLRELFAEGRGLQIRGSSIA